MTNSAVDLGKAIAGIANRLSTVESNIYPDDPSAQLQLILSEGLALNENGFVYVKVYSSNSFILDHPVYGNIDSSVLQLDGGYSTSTLNQTFS
jgi:hypothetical protein